MYDPSAARWLSEDPIGFEGEDTNLYRYVGNNPTNKVDPTGLYELDIHYYMTFYIAISVGLSECDAEQIAWATQAVDYHKDTEPVQLELMLRGDPTSIRRKFHFRTSGDKVVAGSDEAAQIVNDAIKAKQIDNILMGIGLHAFEDSWSHAGYGPKEGHRDNLGPGNPDFPYNDLKKAMAMAEAVYNKLAEYRSKHCPGSKPLKSFEDIKKTLERMMDSRGLEKERADKWKQLIKDDFGITTQYDPKALRDPRLFDMLGGRAKGVGEPKK